MTCTDTWLLARITAVEAEIIVWEEALLALGATGGVQSYTIDTGQGRQTVLRSELSKINETLDSLYNKRTMLVARCTGSNVLEARPGF